MWGVLGWARRDPSRVKAVQKPRESERMSSQGQFTPQCAPPGPTLCLLLGLQERADKTLPGKPASSEGGR